MLIDRSGDDRGFTVVELLVVIVLLGIVSAIATTGLVNGWRASAQAQHRIDAFNELQIALERVARELRAADPVLTGFTGTQVTAQVFRDGGCSHFTPRLANGQLVMDRRTSTDGCATLGPVRTQTLARDVTGGSTATVVPFESGSAAFAFGTADRSIATAPGDITVIRMTLTRDMRDQDPVTVSTVINVRNAR